MGLPVIHLRTEAELCPGEETVAMQTGKAIHLAFRHDRPTDSSVFLRPWTCSIMW